jgi:outer membrane murein-binding lipoprotein Lpp
MESIVVALIGGAVTLAGVMASNSRSRAVMEEKIDELSRRVDKHNCLVERTYALERETALLRNDVDGIARREK